MIVHVHASGFLRWRARTVRCALGRAGLSADKREGDGATPLGCFPFRRVFYRADRTAKPVTRLPVRALVPHDGWCDAPNDPAYNTLIERPFASSHERLWRCDGLYDLIAVIGYNDDPVVGGKGSAIFLHVAKRNFAPTEGCVALERDNLLALLRTCDADTRIAISNEKTV